MNKLKLPGRILLFIFFIVVANNGFGQITSNAETTIPTEYSSGGQDQIHIFCTSKGQVRASLTATASLGDATGFEWTKYNPQTRIFDFFSNDVSSKTTSTISNLTDGCYRVKINAPSGEKIYTAWVFNNYIEAKAEIPESDCTSFLLKGTIDSPVLTYYDLTTGQPKDLLKNIQVKWMEGEVITSRVATTRIFDPPTRDTDYTFEVTDRFGCVAEAEVQYVSIVTKALFSVSEDFGEAPLEVTFTNESENGDPGKFEWFIFRDIDEIKREKEETGAVRDSILIKIFSDNPVYTFENSGKYKVKLVSKKASAFHTCLDTIYFDGYIVADTSRIEVPNVFTPNGDGANDNFVIKFWSMKEIKISIFNRWGKLLHVWESNNVQGFENTVENVSESVWDGKVGGRLATPGVYYYAIVGRGRDGVKQTKAGFFHLFRDK